MERSYLKTWKWKNRSPYSGLTPNESFNLEYRCLRLVNKHYRCICGLGEEERHFPKIISVNKDRYEVRMSKVGISLDRIKEKRRRMTIPKLDKQINCILKNLKRAKVFHLDLHESGKNLCVRESGVLSLIDFDIAVYKDKKGKIVPGTDDLLRKYHKRINPGYDEDFIKRMRLIFP